jgi:hypothetical protein
VWARHGSLAFGCPKTEITADSEAWLELWWTWRQTGRACSPEWTAKDMDALALLEQEWRRLSDEAKRGTD